MRIMRASPARIVVGKASIFFLYLFLPEIVQTNGKAELSVGRQPFADKGINKTNVGMGMPTYCCVKG